MIDLPLFGITVVAFVWHFNRWAFRRDIDTSIDLTSVLPAARFRVVALLAAILLFCWLADFAVWAVFAFLVGIGLAVTAVTGGDLSGSGVGLWVAAYAIREWSFGFPQFILHPETHEAETTLPSDDTGKLMGKTGVTISPLRPTGEVKIDGVIYSVASANGRFVDAGQTVTVTSYRNGLPDVSPSPETHDSG